MTPLREGVVLCPLLGGKSFWGSDFMLRLPTSVSNKSIVVVVLIAAGGVLVASVNWRTNRSLESTPSAVLDILPGDLNLGEVWLQKELPFRLTVRNTSDEPVTVVNFSASCNCTEIVPTAFTIPSFGETIVRGVVDLTHSVHDQQAAKFPFEVTLTAQTTLRGRSILKWPLRGTALRVLDVSPPSIELRGAWEVIEGTSSPTVDVKLAPQIELASLEPEWDAGNADIEFTGPDFDGVYLLRFTPRTDQPAGNIDTRITLRSVLPDGTSGPGIEIPVRGVVVPPVRLSPSRIAVPCRLSSQNGLTDEADDLQPNSQRSGNEWFGQAASGESATVRLIALDRRDWQVVDIVNCPKWLAVDTTVAREITLSNIGRLSGSETAELTVSVQGSGSNTLHLPLTVTSVSLD
ncbi:MAG: hypothetical protein RIK87_07450 [Fuerstiella sp.]